MLKGWLKMKDRRGQALVEFVLVIPIFLLLVFGIVEFGRIFSSQIIVSNASRGGARIAAVNDKADVKTEVVGMSSFITINPDDIIIVYTPSPRTAGGSVKVTVSYDVDIIAPFLPAIIGDPFIVTAETTMHVE